MINYKIAKYTRLKRYNNQQLIEEFNKASRVLRRDDVNWKLEFFDLQLRNSISLYIKFLVKDFTPVNWEETKYDYTIPELFIINEKYNFYVAEEIEKNIINKLSEQIAPYINTTTLNSKFFIEYLNGIITKEPFNKDNEITIFYDSPNREERRLNPLLNLMIYHSRSELDEFTGRGDYRNMNSPLKFLNNTDLHAFIESFAHKYFL